MSKFYFIFLCLLTGLASSSQVYQMSIGGQHTTSSFKTVKFDPSDGGTINGGYIYDSTGVTGRDWLMVKLDKNQKIVWQKIIPNNGDDFIYKAAICSNGDYVFAGTLTKSNISRGFACRVNAATGDINWSIVSSNSTSGEIFYDIIETKAGNIAIGAGDNWHASNTNSFIILLDAAGKVLWSKISTNTNPDQPFALAELPNSNLLIGAHEWVGHYNSVLLELDQLTGNTIRAYSYTIGTTLPNSATYLNSIWPWGIDIKNGKITVYLQALNGCCSDISMCLYNYDTTSRTLSGNIYYHAETHASWYGYVTLDSSDYLVGQSYSDPDRIYLSRVKNSTIVYDNLVNGGFERIGGIDTTGTGAVFSGDASVSDHVNSYNLFSPRTDFATSSSCDIVSANTLGLQTSNLAGVASNSITLVNNGTLNTSPPSLSTGNYILTDVCGSALPVIFINFTATESGKAALLTWEVSSEINNNYYEIERSSDGKTFTAIGRIIGKKAANITSYTYTDQATLHGANFYRIKQVDYDGRFTYSKTVLLDISASALFIISPNPTTGWVNISIPSNTRPSTLIIYDLTGKKIKEIGVSAGMVSKAIDLDIFPAGVYTVKLHQYNQVFTLKVIKK